MPENNRYRAFFFTAVILFLAFLIAGAVSVISELKKGSVWCVFTEHDPVVMSQTGVSVTESRVLEIVADNGERFSLQFCRRCQSLYCAYHQPSREKK